MGGRDAPEEQTWRVELITWPPMMIGAMVTHMGPTLGGTNVSSGGAGAGEPAGIVAAPALAIGAEIASPAMTAAAVAARRLAERSGLIMSKGGSFVGVSGEGVIAMVQAACSGGQLNADRSADRVPADESWRYACAAGLMPAALRLMPGSHRRLGATTGEGVSVPTIPAALLARG
jgi:hypothetical protein